MLVNDGEIEVFFMSCLDQVVEWCKCGGQGVNCILSMMLNRYIFMFFYFYVYGVVYIVNVFVL